MACDLESHGITIKHFLACGNHTCGVFFNDRPEHGDDTYAICLCWFDLDRTCIIQIK